MTSDCATCKAAFRRMDALAATGEDTPEYRAVWAEFETAAKEHPAHVRALAEGGENR